MTQPRSRAARQHGYTLVELLAAIGIFGILAGVGAPHIDMRRQDINTAVNQIVADLRYARARAITTGDHFGVEWIDANEYKIVRLEQQNDGVWLPTTIVKQVELPDHIEVFVSLATAEGVQSGDITEFNTRGMMVSDDVPLWPVIWDSKFAKAHVLSIWPSGQIYEEY